MTNLKILCKVCNKELESTDYKPKSCGCSNMTTINGDKISANDLSKVVMINGIPEEKEYKMSYVDAEWQRQRRERKIRKLDFEVR